MSSAPAPQSNERRITLGQYTADIVVSKRETNCCYYVLQRIGSPEILDMQRFVTTEKAEAHARRALEHWNRKEPLWKIASLGITNRSHIPIPFYLAFMAAGLSNTGHACLSSISFTAL